MLSFVVDSLLGMGVTYGNLHVGEGGNAEESFLRQLREQFFGRIILLEVCSVEVVSEGEFEVGLSEVQVGIRELQGVAHMVDGMWEVVVQGRNIRGSWRWFECWPRIVVEHLLDMRQKIRKEGRAVLVFARRGTLAAREDSGLANGCRNRCGEREEVVEGVADEEDIGDFCSDATSIGSDDSIQSGFGMWGEHVEVDAEDVEDAANVGELPLGTAQVEGEGSSEGVGSMDFVASALEYVQTNKRNTAGLHVLMATLAETNSKSRTGANWVRKFAANVTSRFPGINNRAEYLEAFLHVAHFLVYDDEKEHFPGCMPLRMYSGKTHEWRTIPFVSFAQYVQNVLHDYSSTRAYDPTLAAFAFNVLLNKQLEQAGGAVVKRGYGTSLHNKSSQKEYLQKYGDRVLESLLYDASKVRRHAHVFLNIHVRHDTFFRGSGSI